MPDIGDIYRVVCKGRLAAVVETRNMFSYTLTSANATETEIAVALETKVEQMMGNLSAQLSNFWSVYESETQKWHPPVGGAPGYWLGYHTHANVGAGSLAVDPAGYQAAALVLLKTGAKRVMGRKFIAGIPETMTTNGAITGALLTALGTFAAAMLDSVACGAGGLLKPGVLAKNGSFVQFNSSTVGSIISSMRRRKPGYGI